MTRDVRPLRAGVTVVGCGADVCPHVAVAPQGWDEALRAAIRETPLGLLVRVPCLHGGACTPATGSAGPQLVVQPCDPERRPTGPALVIGPLHERADVDDFCGWLRGGARLPVPSHLLAGTIAPAGVRRAG